MHWNSSRKVLEELPCSSKLFSKRGFCDLNESVYSSIPVEVNGTPIKAFVDSGAQQTISKHSCHSDSHPAYRIRTTVSPECAERCGIMRLLDRRFAGVAQGVGTANILGRIHSAQLKLSDLYLPCSFTVIEGRHVDLLFGLDMLKAHQACIDLEKNVLRIRGREVKFLAEHELPPEARAFQNPDPESLPPGAGPSSGGPSSSNPRQHFPGSGQALGSSPAPTRPGPGRTSNHPESSIQTLMNLGASREDAIQALDAMGGNVDYAASMLFQF